MDLKLPSKENYDKIMRLVIEKMDVVVKLEGGGYLIRLISWTWDTFITKAKSSLEYVTNELTVDMSKHVCTDSIACHRLFSVSMYL